MTRHEAEARRLTTPDERGIIRVPLVSHAYEAGVRDLAAALAAAERRGAERAKARAVAIAERWAEATTRSPHRYSVASGMLQGIEAITVDALLAEDA